MIKEINIKVGKTYPIKYIIEELKKNPDIKLGHVYTLNKHEYRLGIAELEELQKRMIKAEKENTSVHDISGKKKISPYEIHVLGIIDPYSKYEKYEKFYEEFYKQIENAISASESGAVMAPSKDVIEKAREEGLGIEKDRDLFDGIPIYFGRRGIESRTIIKGKEGERKEYIVFGREGAITKEEKVDRKPGEEKGKLISITEHEAKILKESTKDFEPFYSDLEKTVIEFIKNSKEKNAAVEIGNIIGEAKKTIHNVDSKKDIFLRGLVQFFSERGISSEVRKADNYMIFRMA